MLFRVQLTTANITQIDSGLAGFPIKLIKLTVNGNRNM